MLAGYSLAVHTFSHYSPSDIVHMSDDYTKGNNLEKIEIIIWYKYIVYVHVESAITN